MLFLICLAVILATALMTVLIHGGFTSTPKSEIDKAVNQARALYLQRKQSGDNFLNGPCLSNAILPNWVADLVHNPRIPADDQPQNQCPAFLEGSASHFVELDLEGNLIRAK